MRPFTLVTCVTITLFVTGCAIQDVTVSRDELMRSYFPYGARWVKDSMTRQSRKVDWLTCGGGQDLSNGFRDWISSQESRESYFSGLERHSKQLSTCIQAKGYAFKYHPRPGLPDECTADICLYP